MQDLEIYIGKDFEAIGSKDFEEIIAKKLKKEKWKIKRQFSVKNRYDGRKGRIDFFIEKNEKTIAIEIDRMSVREKSIFKLRQSGADELYAITRSPFTIKQIYYE